MSRPPPQGDANVVNHARLVATQRLILEVEAMNLHLQEENSRLSRQFEESQVTALPLQHLLLIWAPILDNVLVYAGQ